MSNRTERRIAAARSRHAKGRSILEEIRPYNYAFVDGINTLYKFKAFATPFDEEVVRENRYRCVRNGPLI